MNWDISIGHFKQLYGRLLQRIGTRIGSRKLVLTGERAEYAGRLQMRYGALKHQAQWNPAPLRMRRDEIASVKKSMSI